MAEVKEAANKKVESKKIQVSRGERVSQVPRGEIKMPRDTRGTSKTRGTLSAPVYSLLGKVTGSLELPKEIFGVKVNEGLLVQAMRVYMNNRKGHNSNTKTRGEVTGSTRKIYAQKGTGRARHGGITAPIFVGGGIALGPKYRKTILDLPKKMKNASLISALSSKALSGEILGLAGIDKLSGKTKEMVKLMSLVVSSQLSDKKQKRTSILIVADKNLDGVQRAVRNIQGVHFLNADQINVFEVIRHESLVLTKEAVERLQARFAKKELKVEDVSRGERVSQVPRGEKKGTEKKEKPSDTRGTRKPRGTSKKEEKV